MISSVFTSPSHIVLPGETTSVGMPKRRGFTILVALIALAYAPCKADVAAPPAPPPPPAGYCTQIYNELNGDLQAFNSVLATPPTWTPMPGGATLYGGNLEWANGNTGPSISASDYMQSTVQPQLQELQALGVQAVLVPVLFPILYEPFYGSQAAFQPYLNFYTQVAQAVRAAGLKLIVDNEILFSNDTAAGWTNMNAFYGPLTWQEYIDARAQMAATIAQAMQPDYLMLANEPDTEAIQTGQQSLNNPVNAAQMVAEEIAAVQALNLSPVPKLGAGFGSWMPATGTASLLNYINAYIALPLDYIDFHLLPINTVQNSNFLNNALTIASMAAAAGKPVAISQAWLEDETAEEVNVLSIDVVRARGPFTFWSPLNNYFLQTAQALAQYTNMVYLVPQFPVYLFAQQTYGGTASNGGAANCTCTTASCSDYDIMQTENVLASAADQQSVFTATAVGYYNQLVTTADATPPTVPANLAGTAGTAGAKLSWTPATDDVGVAGYSVFRCTPPAAGQPCEEVWIANSTLSSYNDSTVASNTLYTYQVQAFDFANNDSPLSQTLSLQTLRTSGDSATNLVATPVSAQEIDLSWSPPTDPTGLGQYQVLGGTSPSNLQQIVVATSTTTTYRNQPLSPGTTYYYAIIAVEEGIAAPMTPVVTATTLPLPNPPSNVAATATPATIALTWQENLQPNGLPIGYYQIYQGTTPGNLAKVASATGAKYTATSLTANTAYYFEVVAVDTGHGASTPSDQFAVTTPALPGAPAGLAAAPTSTTQVALTWSANLSPGGMPLTGYYIFRGTAPSSLLQVASAAGTAYTDYSLTSGVTYYYAVEALDQCGDVSPMSAVVSAATLTLPTPPTSLVATPISTKQIGLAWAAGPSGLPVASFIVLRGTAPSSLVQVASVTAPAFNDYPPTSGVTYYYAVEEKDANGNLSPMSAVVSAATLGLPTAPANLAATPISTSQMGLSWTAGPSGLPLTGYYVFRGTAPSALTKVGAATAPAYTDYALTAGTTYYYAVEEIDQSGNISPMSAVVSAETLAPPSPPANLAATPISTKQIGLAWTAGPSGLPVASYIVFRGAAASSLVQVACVTATTYYDYPPASGVTYYYAVEEKDTLGNLSPMSATVSAATLALPAAPANLTATPLSAAQIGLAWTAGSSGLPLSGFYIFRGTAPSGLIKVGAAAPPVYTDYSLTAGTTYYYAVEEIDQSGNVSPMSEVESATTLPRR
jgi:fibronectin type 3 domain-containing protein